MPDISHLQTNLNAGEFSGHLAGRVDFEKYKNGAALMENYIPMIQGGMTKRPGTYFVAEVKDSTKLTRLIPFEFSTTQAYVLEFSHNAIRVCRDRGQVLEATKAITAITQNNPGVITAVGHGFSNGDDVFVTGVLGMTQVNGRVFNIANVTADTFEIQDLGGTNINTGPYTTYTSGGTVARIYTLATTYTEADLFQLKFVQSADVLYITHPSHPPRKLTRTGHTSWTLTDISFLDGPYFPQNTTATTITPSATTGAITLTASAATFVSTDVGRAVRMLHGSTWGWALITGFTSSTVVNATVQSAFGAATAQTTWRLGLYSGTTGYPACSMFYEDRLFFAGATATPQRLDGSKTGDYENFAPTSTAGVIAADNAVSFTLNAETVNVARWLMNDDKGLQVGTVGGEWQVRASTNGEALSPTNIRATRATSWGSANLQALRAGEATLYVQRAGKQLRELAYVYQIDGLRSPDLTVLADHVLDGGVLQFDYQQTPLSLVWLVREDGVLSGLSYDRPQDIIGWHRHIIGGALSGGDSLVESVAVIPEPLGTYDDVWLIVQRTIAGRNVRYIEWMKPLDTEDTAQADAFYVDCGVTYDGASASSFSGAWHLEGQTLNVLADGAVRPAVVVSNGSFSIDAAQPASVVHAGFGYNADFKTMRPEGGSAQGTAQGKIKKISRLTLRLHQTLGLKVGRSFDNLVPVIFRTTSDPMSVAPPLFTGDVRIDWEGDQDMDAYVCLRSDQPLPATVLMLAKEMRVNDR